MKMWRWGLAAIVAAGAAACAAFGEFASDDPGLSVRPGRFEGRFLAVSDADMAATAYADGRLERIPDARDALTLFDAGARLASAPASNSVVSWPQVVEVSPDGQFAFVVETRGSPEDGVTRYANVADGLPVGTRLSIFALKPGGLRLVEQREGLGRNLGSVTYVHGLHALAIVNRTPGAELVIARLADNGAIASVDEFALRATYRDDDVERSINTIHVAPDGLTLAANIANRRVQFYRLQFDASGDVIGAEPLGGASPDLGRRLSVGKWTPDGRFFLITDTNGGAPGPLMLVQGPGAVIVLRPPKNAESAPAIVDRVEVGRFPEGLDISPFGDRVATINLERTYLPELAPLAFWPGRRRYSVSLLALDPATGALEDLDRVHQAGVLPEDVIFDASGRNLAVAVFRRRGPDRRRGFIDFFSITDGARLASQGVTQPLTRGAHDLVLAP